jgi:zinc transporter ZupT
LSKYFEWLFFSLYSLLQLCNKRDKPNAMPFMLPSIFLALFAAIALVLGSLLPTLPTLRARFTDDRLAMLIGFSAGLMLATALHELLPEALEKNHDSAMWGVTGGFMALYLAERLTHFHACRHRHCDLEDDATIKAAQAALAPAKVLVGAHAHDEHEHHRHTHHEASGDVHFDTHAHGHVHHHPVAPMHGHADVVALVGMSIHNFSDGLITAAAFAVSQTVGVVVILAIVLHQLAAGLSLGAIMLRAGRHRRRVLFSTVISASCILWGVLFYHQVVPVGESMQGIVLGIAGGSFLYVAACDLLPEAHAEDEGWTITATTILGYAFAVGVKVFFGGHGHSH